MRIVFTPAVPGRRSVFGALVPVAVVGIGAVARALAERLLRLDDARLAQLRGVAARDRIVVLGDADVLPWVDGAIYLGRDARAARLLLPTTQLPALPLEIFEQAIVARSAGLQAPLAVLATPRQIFSCAEALPIARQRLERWLEAAR